MIEGDSGQNEFYLTLPSNSSKAYFGKQETSHYKTKLHGSVRLDPSKWLVGLAEITYPATYDNIPTCDFTVEYQPGADDPLLPDGEVGWNVAKCTLKGKHYLSPGDLITLWTRAFAAHPNYPYFKTNVQLSYDKVNERATFTFSPAGFTIKLPHPLASALGFGEENGDVYADADGGGGGIQLPKATERNEPLVKVRAQYTADVDRLVPMIYVYCDLIERQRVGDAYVPLLRTLPTRTDVRGDLITETFDNIHYGDVALGTFETVEIQLVDRLGINMSFRRGDVIVKLHFKRKT